MKRILALLLAVMMLLTVFAACGAKDDAASGSSSGAGAAEITKFTVGFDAAFPPYGYRNDNGEYVGFDLDLAAEVCSRNGWELVKQPIDWDSKDFELNSGTVDCLWNGFTMNGREDDYTFSEPYINNTQVFVVAADSGIATHADLAGKIVGVQTASSALDALESEDCAELKASFAEVQTFPEYETAFLNLQSGAIDAIAMDVGVADYQLANRGNGYVKLEQNLSTEQYAVAFKKGNTELRDKVQATLDAMVTDGTFARIAEEWELSDKTCLGK